MKQTSIPLIIVSIVYHYFMLMFCLQNHYAVYEDATNKASFVRVYCHEKARLIYVSVTHSHTLAA